MELYRISDSPSPLALPDMTSFDAASRQLPQGVFSTFRTFGGCTRALDLKHHLDRLYAPASALHLAPSIAREALRGTLVRLLKVYQPGEARVRISLATEGEPGQVFLMLETLKPLPETVYQQGVWVVLSHVARTDPRIKSTAFIQRSSQERQILAESGAFEGLMAQNGRIFEGLTSNFYAIRAEKLITAQKGILLGITRRIVLRLARKAGLRLEYRPLRVSELATIDEAFITSSSRGVVPVVKIGDRPVGQGRPGAVTRQLSVAYNAYVETRAELIAW